MKAATIFQQVSPYTRRKSGNTEKESDWSISNINTAVGHKLELKYSKFQARDFGILVEKK